MTQTTKSGRGRSIALLAAAFVVGALLMAGLAALLLNIQEKKTEATQFPLKVLDLAANELNPEVWGRNFPREFSTFNKMQDTTLSTPFGGSVKYSKLEKDPLMIKLWAPYPFSVEYNTARGHFYALTDQMATRRIQVVNQPGACANCHAAEAPQLIASMGWETFNKTPYNEIKDKLHYGSSCADCHDPQTMSLRITRPALLNALKARNIDITQATRQEMRTYVCAQCHVEYYFAGDNKVLTFPWSNGLNIDNIEEYYTKLGFRDWVHKDTGASMLKMQHPEYEMYSSGIHARSNVACADCHMPYVRDGSVKVSDHWIRSPLTNISNACQPCHRWGDEELKNRVLEIQTRTARQIKASEEALSDAIDAMVAAKNAGAGDADLAKARDLHRRASMRWDFVSSENSTGFHSPQEAMRILGDSINFARQAQVEALKLTQKK
ncbi:MAG: ammonia-forming cytochrome c nitrite reductase subunit c552 [Chloroflexi bacterium]|nr:ammonia-forming cytochrome c nitrite reductase subunit c552 [Chloroflexota bacterium]